MKALIDLDILPYELGAVFDETVHWRKVIQAVDHKVAAIVTGAKCSSFEGYLTDSKTNFRIDVATVAPYKGHRPQDKPHYWKTIRNYLLREHNAVVATGCEADDLIADECLKDIDNTVICSRDKDLDTVPGWHYRWQCGERQPEKRYYVNDEEAFNFFVYQMLVGDIADNIKGVHGVGDKKAKKILSECSSKEEMLRAVKETYISVYGEGSDEPIYYETENKQRVWKRPTEIMKENAELLWIGTVNRDKLNEIEV